MRGIEPTTFNYTCREHAVKTTSPYPAGMYLFELNYRRISTMCEICSDLTTNTPEQRRCRSCTSIFNFEQISRNVLVFPVSTLKL